VAFIGSAIRGVASIYASNKQSDAANQAAELQRQQMAQNQSNMQPFITGGQGASNLLQSFYGLGGNPALGQGALDKFYQSPDYQFALKGGAEALNNSLAAKGGALGGNAIKAQTDYSSGLATQNLGNYLQRLGGMAGQGVSAASGIASPNTTGAAYAGNAMMGAGTAQAAGALGVSGAFTQGTSNYLTNYKNMNQSSYADGGGGTGFSLTGTGGLY
jgi:hypothetical protein